MCTADVRRRAPALLRRRWRDARASDAATLLVRKPQVTLRDGRKAFYDAVDEGFSQGVANAVDTFCEVALSEQGREGVRAFAEKRKPSWLRD